MPSNNIPVLALAADMIFTAKIRATGDAVGVPVLMARNAIQLLELAGTSAPRLILVDLDTRGLDISATIADVKAAAPESRLLGFVSHVNTDAIRQARDAGADQVLARSAFTQQLPDILKSVT
jgi:DNA-binding NarL/FixJ family response regulator